jgi:hypothetical protein
MANHSAGSLRRLIGLYRAAATPEVLHRAVKTFWQGVTGGGIGGLAFTSLIHVPQSTLQKLAITTLAAVGSGVASLIGNILAEADRLVAEVPRDP